MTGNHLLAFVMVALTLAAAFSACGVDNSAPDSREETAIAGEESAAQSEAGIQNSGSETPPDSPATARRSDIIKAVVSKNCNYVYHMLSISQCGYVNDYGNTYKTRHAAADLQTLKGHEQLLTVVGGEHQGDLYFLMVVLPASLDDEIPVQDYFAALADLFGTGDIERNFEAYREIYELSFSSVTDVSLESFREFYSGNELLKTEISQIAAVMRDNYTIYTDEVWETSLAALTQVTEALNREFAENDFAGKWEAVLNRQYGQDAFYALMCNSMENGVNGINITVDKDVFDCSGEHAATAQFISHEFGIYLLMDALADTEAFQGYTYYGLVEGLAEYYNTLVSDGYEGWSAGAEYMDFFKQLHDSEPEITAEEMFLRAVAHFMPGSAE